MTRPSRFAPPLNCHAWSANARVGSLSQSTSGSRARLQVAQTCQLALRRIQYWRNRRAEEAAAPTADAPAAAPASELKGSKKEQFSAAFAGDDAAAARAGEESGSPFMSGEKPALTAYFSHPHCTCFLTSGRGVGCSCSGVHRRVFLPATTLHPQPGTAVDPVPPADDAVASESLRATLESEDAEMFDRYRAMFALRNRGTKDLVALLARRPPPCLVSRALLRSCPRLRSRLVHFPFFVFAGGGGRWPADGAGSGTSRILVVRVGNTEPSACPTSPVCVCFLPGRCPYDEQERPFATRGAYPGIETQRAKPKKRLPSRFESTEKRDKCVGNWNESVLCASSHPIADLLRAGTAAGEVLAGRARVGASGLDPARHGARSRHAQSADSAQQLVHSLLICLQLHILF